MDTLAVVAGLLLLAVLVEPLARRLHLPVSAILVILGFAGSELVIAVGADTGLRWQQFNFLILHVFVPVLVFESAFNANSKVLIQNLGAILLLAIPFMVLAALITGVIVYLGIDHPSGFPWIAALLCGVILSATDPVAVVALFKQLGAPARLTALLEGESLFNDATAIVLFMLLAQAAVAGTTLSASAAALDITQSLIGGTCAGGAAGLVGVGLYRLFSDSIVRALSTIICAYLAFYAAEHLLSVSGVVAVLITGLILGACHKKYSVDDGFAGEVWELCAYGSNALLFVLAGVTITWQMFSTHWLAMLIGISAITVTRGLLVYGLLPASLRALPVDPLPKPYKPVLMWGGLRGAVALALALSLPTELNGWYTVQSIVYGVVLFTLFVQAPAMPALVRRTI